jgi:DNA polymerase-3 subunit gamma/tau
MLYKALARKYRPQSFEEIVGQEIITETLKNAIKLGRIAHAYLFYGPRGTGKTSTARILAKAINCKQPVDTEPCNNCDVCEEITKGISIDVIEIDGASNRGIDEIRQLRESTKFMPAKYKYKIYIIDEVHMLTEPAFNALLKILEEPPPHIIFIMATTDFHRIPSTIISRCQVFSFKKLTTSHMKNHLVDILDKEEVAYEDDAISLVVRNSDGCMRDALSLIDQVIAYTKGQLSYSVLYKLLGLTEREIIYKLLQAIFKGEKETIVFLCDEINNKGLEYSYILEQLILYIKYLLYYIICNTFPVEEITKEEEKILKELLPFCNEQKLFLLFQLLLKLINDIKIYSFDRLIFEIGLFRAINVDKLIPIDKYIDRQINEKHIEVDKRYTKNMPQEEDNLSHRKSGNQNGTTFRSIDNESWRELLNNLGKIKPTLSINLSYGYFEILGNNTLHVIFSQDKKFHYQFVKKRENFDYLKNLILSQFPFIRQFEVLLSTNEEDNKKKSILEEVKELETYKIVKMRKEVRDNPLISKIIENFNGNIESINILTKEDIYEYTTNNETGTESSTEDEGSSGEPG